MCVFVCMFKGILLYTNLPSIYLYKSYDCITVLAVYELSFCSWNVFYDLVQVCFFLLYDENFLLSGSLKWGVCCNFYTNTLTRIKVVGFACVMKNGARLLLYIGIEIYRDKIITTTLIINIAFTKLLYFTTVVCV